jgi:hypothetical protein
MNKGGHAARPFRLRSASAYSSLKGPTISSRIFAKFMVCAFEALLELIA